MKQFKWLLLPFSWIYGGITFIRNRLYDLGIKKSYVIQKKAIVVGNLSVGGTGKTPLVSYIVNYLLHSNRNVSTLSRGYGRATKGVLFASKNATANEIGDEPLIYHKEFPNAVVVVAEKRKDGVQQILQKHPEIDVIVLDDAFQHRAVSAGLSILVTEFERPFSADWIVPVGRLREGVRGAKRADIIVVSKCPTTAQPGQKEALKKALAKYGQHVFFSSIGYRAMVSMNHTTVNSFKNVLLVTGIGNPKPLFDHLNSKFEVTHLKFADHHDFTAKDIETIHQKFNTFASHDKIIVTTEKDFMRLRAFEEIISGSIPWFYQPIDVRMDNEEQFKNLLEAYVREI